MDFLLGGLFATCLILGVQVLMLGLLWRVAKELVRGVGAAVMREIKRGLGA